MRDGDTSEGLPLAILIVLEDLLLVDFRLEPQIRTATLEEPIDYLLLGEAACDLHRGLRLTEADLADRIGHRTETLHESVLRTAESEHHFAHDALLLLDLGGEFAVAFLFEFGDPLLVGALDTQLREGVVGELGEEFAHAPGSLGVLHDLFESFDSHGWTPFVKWLLERTEIIAYLTTTLHASRQYVNLSAKLDN